MENVQLQTCGRFTGTWAHKMCLFSGSHATESDTVQAKFERHSEIYTYMRLNWCVSGHERYYIAIVVDATKSRKIELLRISRG